MKKILCVAVAVLALAACNTLPIDVYALRTDMTLEELHGIAARPDQVKHYRKDGHVMEQWLYREKGIRILFEDGMLVEWSN